MATELVHPCTPRTPTVMLVEDEDLDVVQFQRLAKRFGLDVPLLIARDGSEALRILRMHAATASSASPIVIVTDINMPGLSGHELIEEVRRDPSLSGAVVFVLTSSDLQSDIKRAYDRQVAGYIVKSDDGNRMQEGVQMLVHFCRAVSLPA